MNNPSEIDQNEMSGPIDGKALESDLLTQTDGLSPFQLSPMNSRDGHEQSRDPQRIAELAYAYWEAHGGGDGSAEEDWHQAEQGLRQHAALLRGQ